eukprot:1505693-Alexandrium_andersonii.AAC.1
MPCAKAHNWHAKRTTQAANQGAKGQTGASLAGALTPGSKPRDSWRPDLVEATRGLDASKRSALLCAPMLRGPGLDTMRALREKKQTAKQG